jgi:hypothetical protein
VLGRLVTTGRENVTLLTSTGYLITIFWTGQFAPAQIWYTGPCSSVGTGWLNNGQGDAVGAPFMSGRWLVYSGSLNSLMQADTVTNGTSASSLVTAQSIDNPTCQASAGSFSGWKLKTITRAAAGLPATIATPLTID